MGGLSSVTVGDRRRVQLWVITLGVIAAAWSRVLSPPDGRRRFQLGQQPSDGKRTNPDAPAGHVTQAHHVAGLSRPIALPVPLPSLPWPMAYYNGYLLPPGSSSKPTSRLFLPQDAHRNAGLFRGGSGWTGWTGGGGGGGGGGVFNPHPTLQALDLPDLSGPAPGEGGGGGGGSSSPGPGQGMPPTPGVTGVIINDGPNHPPTSLLPPGGPGTLRSPDHPHPSSPTRGESYPFMWQQSDVWVWPDQVVTGALPSLQLGAPAKATALRGQGPPTSGQASSGQAPAPSVASPTQTDRGVLKGRGGSLPPSKGPSLGSPHSVPFTVGTPNHPQGSGGDPWGTRSGNILSVPFTLSSSRQVASRNSQQHVDDVTDLTTVAERQSEKATAQSASKTVSVTSAPSGERRPPMLLHTTLEDSAHYRSRTVSSAVDSVAQESLEKQSSAEVDTFVEEITKVDSIFRDKSQA